eukprot:208425_1
MMTYIFSYIVVVLSHYVFTNELCKFSSMANLNQHHYFTANWSQPSRCTAHIQISPSPGYNYYDANSMWNNYENILWFGSSDGQIPSTNYNYPHFRLEAELEITEYPFFNTYDTYNPFGVGIIFRASNINVTVPYLGNFYLLRLGTAGIRDMIQLQQSQPHGITNSPKTLIYNYGYTGPFTITPHQRYKVKIENHNHDMSIYTYYLNGKLLNEYKEYPYKAWLNGSIGLFASDVSATFYSLNFTVLWPTNAPTMDPTVNPTSQPTNDPTTNPTLIPTDDPTRDPSNVPSVGPTTHPTLYPTNTYDPSVDPTSNTRSSSEQSNHSITLFQSTVQHGSNKEQLGGTYTYIVGLLLLILCGIGVGVIGMRILYKKKQNRQRNTAMFVELNMPQNSTQS